MAEVLDPSWRNLYNLWLANAQKNAPALTLPDGRFHTTINRRKDQTSLDIIGRAGCTAIMDNQTIDRIYCFEWTHSKICDNAGKAGNGDGSYAILNQDDMIRIANTVPLNWCEGNELGEGLPWGMPFYADQKRWYLQERKRMYQAAGRTYRNYGTYGGFENFNGDAWLNKTDGNQSIRPNDDRAPFKGYIQTVQGARSSCEYFSRFEDLCGAFVKNYVDLPDWAPDFYRKFFAAEVMGKGMGRTGGIGPGRLGYLDWPNMEQLGGGQLHNGFLSERAKPDGSVQVQAMTHPQIPIDAMIGDIFGIGFCMTDGYLPFDETIFHGVDPSSNDFPYEPQNWHDAGFIAAYRYSQCERTAGQPWQHCRYRFDGSDTWIEPSVTSTLDHASANAGPYGQGRRGRPHPMFRVNGSALDFWAFDPSQGKNKSDSIILQPLPGHEYKINLRGQTLRQFRETI